MINLKPPISYEAQLQKLKEHKLIIEDEAFALSVLKSVNYYRLTGYGIQFRISPESSDYQQGASFNTIYSIYCFDEAMRNVLRPYIEKVELYYRGQIAYGFAISECKKPPHDQHYDRNNFYKKDFYDKIMEKFDHEKERQSDSLIVKSHERKYEGKMPLWVMVELMSFSSLSQLYGVMYINDKKRIADAVCTGPTMLENNLHCISNLRNKCAHGARLYNIEMNPPCQMNDSFKRLHPDLKLNSLFTYLIVLEKRLPDDESKENFFDDISNVIEAYSDYIDLSLIGFPADWKTILRK